MQHVVSVLDFARFTLRGLHASLLQTSRCRLDALPTCLVDTSVCGSVPLESYFCFGALAAAPCKRSHLCRSHATLTTFNFHAVLPRSREATHSAQIPACLNLHATG